MKAPAATVDAQVVAAAPFLFMTFSDSVFWGERKHAIRNFERSHDIYML